MDNVRDRALRCSSCGRAFVLRAHEKNMMAGVARPMPPCCRVCRQARAQAALAHLLARPKSERH